MPGLARVFEQEGISTVTVTMMPIFAERAQLSRTVGVPFPFGQPFGMNAEMQTQVLRAALDLAATAIQPEARVDLEIDWPVSRAQAYRDWQPPEPSPIVEAILAGRFQPASG